ncbi:universal stress protein [Halosimplex aquaticum]|uniref:Universal stress protein n=1 Tax=Halosimplex aquaticum TaxID=3026162 RepID=A0ABD5Y688_9EURY|nr:universal stress protein [Halosimplex aquaticum]
MYERILVPTDGSAASEAAIETALTLARRFDATLYAIHVLELDELPPEFDAGARAELQTRAESLLATIADWADDASVSTVTEVVEPVGLVRQAIVDYLDEQDVDLVVMGTQGRTGLHELVLGSVTERTLRLSPIPVLTVHEETELDPEFDAILVPTDGSEVANAAADHGIELAGRADAALHALHVVDVTGFWTDVDSPAVLSALEEAGQRAVDDVVDRASEAGLGSVEASVSSGTPASGIVDYADDRDVDLIVMGTHGRTGLDRFLLGSVAEKVVRVSDIPVLAVSVDPEQ